MARWSQPRQNLLVLHFCVNAPEMRGYVWNQKARSSAFEERCRRAPPRQLGLPLQLHGKGSFEVLATTPGMGTGKINHPITVYY